MLRIIVIIFSIFFFEGSSFSQDEYFLTLRYDKVNLRQGPSRQYPIKIFYKKKFLPVLILDESDNFRKIRDHENNSGWIHWSQLKKINSIISLEDKILFKKPSNFSKPLAKIKKGRLLILQKCDGKWCKIKTEKFKGWIKMENVWGFIK